MQMDLEDDEYHDTFLGLINSMEKMKSKKWEEEDSPQVQEDVVKHNGMGEVLLPVYWNTQVRHMLVCRFVNQLDTYGSLWAIAMLVIECYHCLVKNLGRSRKSMMASIVNNYEIFDVRHTDWDVKERKIQGDLKELVTRYEMYPEKPENKKVSIGKRQKLNKIVLSETDYLKIIRLYSESKNLTLANLVCKYLTAVEKNKRVFFYLHNWEARNLTVAEKKLQETIGRYQKANGNTTYVSCYSCFVK
jgi:hypothetical protein